VKSLQEVTSQEESFKPNISGYIRERVNGVVTSVQFLSLGVEMLTESASLSVLNSSCFAANVKIISVFCREKIGPGM